MFDEPGWTGDVGADGGAPQFRGDCGQVCVAFGIPDEDGRVSREKTGDARASNGVARVAGEGGFRDGNTVDIEEAIADGAAESGIGGDVEEGAIRAGLVEGGEFGGDVAAEGRVGLFVDVGFWGDAGQAAADLRGGAVRREVPGFGVDDLERGVCRAGERQGDVEAGGCEEGGAFERASGIVGEYESLRGQAISILFCEDDATDG